MSFTSGAYAGQGWRLLNDSNEIVPNNTKLAYQNFQEEFKGFCEAKHPNDHFPHCVTEEKLFGFLWYQAYREKRPRSQKHDTFDLEDYEKVVSAHPPDRESQFNEDEIQASNYPGFSSWEKCRSAIMNLAMQQRSENSNSNRIDDFKTNRMESLKRYVIMRAPHIKEARFDEKMDEDTIPYRMVEFIKPLEQKFWEYKSNHLSQSMVSLRNRLFYLFTLTALVRGESLWRLCLSDFFAFFYSPQDEPHPYHVVVCKILIAKNNKGGKPLYGRVIRHKDVNMCAIGALAFYLLTRFECTHEDRELDFRVNQNWFNIKLMASVTNNMKAVGNKQFASAIQDHLTELGVTSCHAIHFGRSEGPKLLELEELESTSIKCLGNWSPDTQEKVYSAKMPLSAMRVANGHVAKKGCHFNPRMMVEPPGDLCQSIFPFIERAEEVLSTAPDSEKRVTAQAFLYMMRTLRKVVLQDAAAMMIVGRTHAIFDNHPAFQHPSFIAFKAEMAAALSSAPVEEPANVVLERMMPAVLHHFGNLASARNQDRAFANEQFSLVQQNVASVDQRIVGVEE